MSGDITPRRLVAVHEAGHAVAHVVLGRPVACASIRPGKRYAGVAIPEAAGLADVDGFDPSKLVTGQPPAFRTDIERRIVVLMAGEAAVTLLAGSRPAAGYSDDETDVIARKALDALPPRVLELVKAAEEDERPGSDHEHAERLAWAIAGDHASLHYLAWLRCQAEALVIGWRAAIIRVADALERRAVLTGDEIAALVHG
jgi:hypothetical protein